MTCHIAHYVFFILAKIHSVNVNLNYNLKKICFFFIFQVVRVQHCVQKSIDRIFTLLF